MKKPVLLISHLLYWALTYISVPYIFTIATFMVAHWLQEPAHLPKITYHVEVFSSTIILFTGIGAIIFYASYFSLNFFVKRPLRFVWIVLFYVISTLVLSLPADLVSDSAAMNLGPILYFNASGFLFKACIEWIRDRKLKLQLEKDRDASQLELLRSKIDPHFLFNNLNNIDVFIQEEPKLASDYLKKLSDILRFMLYDANTNCIPLSKELEYIVKYIELQKIRTANPNFVKFEVRGETTNKRIAPMILIHFIENAFKYASNKKIEDAIVIRFDISEKKLTFLCKNHVGPAAEPLQVKNGLGITLLKQKLDLLYHNEYTLISKQENNWYIVNLDIRLDED